MSEWPRVGNRAMVKCSDLRWREAECVLDRGNLAWRFADGALRLLATSTAKALSDQEDGED